MSILRKVTPGRYRRRHRKLVIAADSVAAGRHPDNEVLSGWGQHLGALLQDDVEVVNTASDSCTSHWYFRHRLPAVLESLAPQDLFLVGFGVCEQAVARPDLHLTPREFRAYLHLYVDVLRDRGITPVLATQTARHVFGPDGVPRPPAGGYSEHTRTVAARRGVALLDLERATAGLLAGWGPERARGYFRWFEPGQHPDCPDGIIDTLHLNRQGARAVAQLAADGLHALGLVAPTGRRAPEAVPQPLPPPSFASGDEGAHRRAGRLCHQEPIVLTPRRQGTGHPTLRFTGTAPPGTTHVVFRQGGTVLGAAGVNPSRHWQWRHTRTWPDGEHELTVTAVSDRGRSAPATVPFRVRAHVPAPVVTAPAADSLNGPGPVFKGTVGPGVRAVTASCDGRWLGQAEPAEGTWRFRLPHDWQPGRHTVEFTAVAEGGSSPPASVTFDVLAVPETDWLRTPGPWRPCTPDGTCAHIKRLKPAGARDLLE